MIEIESGNRSGRSFADPLFIDGQHDRRTVKPLHQPCRYNAHHTQMPAAGRQHDRRRRVALTKHRHRFLHNFSFQVLPAAIEQFQFLRKLHRFRFGLRRQQLHPFDRMIQTPGRIQPRTQLESHRLSRTFPRHSGHLFQRANPAARPARQFTQPRLDKSPILILQRHDIGDGRQGHEIEQRIERHGSLAIALPVGIGYLVGQPAGAEPAERIARLPPVRIHDRQRRRHLFISLMVVRDDDVQAQLIGDCNFMMRRGAAI